jgi:hypothetical protein
MIYHRGVSIIQKFEGTNTHHSVDCNHLAENDADSEQRSAISVCGVCEKTHLIKFLVLILGVLTPPPSIDAPVKNIPLQNNVSAIE